MSTEATPIRAFFAIDLSDSAKLMIHDIIQELQQSYAPAAVRWVKPQSLHITLQFLKLVSRQDLDSLITEVAPAIQDLPRLAITLGPVQFFPTATHPALIALDTQPQPQLLDLSKTIGQCMAAVGIPPEKRLYRGHITLGRFNFNTAKEPVTLPALTLPALPVEKPHEIILYQSQPKPAESHYMALHRLPFAN